MNPNREELVYQLPLTTPAAGRALWLDRECGVDKGLCARLEALVLSQTHGRLPA